MLSTALVKTTTHKAIVFSRNAQSRPELTCFSEHCIASLNIMPLIINALKNDKNTILQKWQLIFCYVLHLVHLMQPPSSRLISRQFYAFHVFPFFVLILFKLLYEYGIVNPVSWLSESLDPCRYCYMMACGSGSITWRHFTLYLSVHKTAILRGGSKLLPNIYNLLRRLNVFFH